MTRPTKLRSAETLLIACLLLVILFAARATAAPMGFVDDTGADEGGFGGNVEIRFAGTERSRTLVETSVAIPASSVVRNEHGYYNLRLSGEVQIDGRRYDRFRYRYDVADDGKSTAPILLSFARTLRPGEYDLVLDVEDLAADRTYRTRRDLVVPSLGDPGERSASPTAVPPAPPIPAEVAILAPDRPILIGMQRFVARTQGDVAAVVFSLDERPILTSRRAPHSVELDLGERAEVRELRADALDIDGRIVATSHRLLNTGGQQFTVSLTTRRVGEYPFEDLVAEAAVEIPEGRSVESLELILDDTHLATLREPPFRQRISRAHLPGDTAERPLLRALAQLDDGRVAEATTIAGGEVENVQVELVELFPAVRDRRGRPVTDLSRGDIEIRENSIPQVIRRFERVDGLPVHAALLLDISSSMNDRLAGVTAAAGDFIATSLRPEDSAMLVTFADRARTAVDFTSDRALLANALIGLETAGSTALFDSVLYALERFDGRRGGQRALLVLSDGQDEKSHSGLREVLELARRTGVTIYTIGLDGFRYQSLDREVLHELAVETGGRSYLIDDVDELAGIYDEIDRDLRSRYLVAYQSSNSHDAESFRVVDLEVRRPGLEARVARGYYP